VHLRRGAAQSAAPNHKTLVGRPRRVTLDCWEPLWKASENQSAAACGKCCDDPCPHVVDLSQVCTAVVFFKSYPHVTPLHVDVHTGAWVECRRGLGLVTKGLWAPKLKSFEASSVG